jgi:hypothetical protein
MEGFKPFKKVQCFKEGGSVKYESRKEHKEEMSADVAQDKKIVKKAFKMHDEQEHKGEKTNLSKLKKGGRAKKETGTVKKYKTGGAVTNVYEAKKSSGDKDNIKAVKDIKPAKLCGGKSVRKMADGGGLGSLPGTLSGVGTGIRDAVLGTPQQNAIASQKEKEYLRAKMAQKAAGAKLGPAEEMATGLAGMGQKLQPAAPGGMKKGGKAKKDCK